MSYIKYQGNYGTNSTLLTHPTSEILVVNAIDDILVMDMAIDGGRGTVTPSGWTEIKEINAGAIGHTIIWKRATAPNETLPDITLATADQCICNAYIVIGCPTASDPVDSITNNTGNDAAPTWLSATHSAFTASAYSCAMDADKPLTIGDIPVSSSEDLGATGCCIGFSFNEFATATGQKDGTASNNDGWQTAVVIWKDSGDTRAPTYFEVAAGELIDESLFAFDGTTFRDTLHNTGMLSGEIQKILTFDASTGVDTGTNTITINETYTDARIIYKLDANGNTPPTGLVDGSYYAVMRLTDTTVQFVNVDSIDTVFATVGYTPQGISAVGSGTIRLEESAINLQSMGTDYDVDMLGYGSNHTMNYSGSSWDFTTPIDLTDTGFGFSIRIARPGRFFDVVFVAIDSSGNWKNWKIQGSEAIIVTEQQLIDIENSNKERNSYGAFDASDVKNIIIMGRVPGVGGEPLILSQPYKTGSLVVLGGDIVTPANCAGIFEALNLEIEGTSFQNDFQYGFFHNIQLGNATNRTIFEDTSKSILFPKLADGVDLFRVYYEELGLSYSLNSSSSAKINSSQIGSSAPFNIIVTSDHDASSTTELSSSTILNGNLSLDADFSADDVIIAGGETLELNGADLNGWTIDSQENPVLITTATVLTGVAFKNMANAIEIDTAGDYDLSTNSFDNNTNDLQITETTGTVNITIDFSPNPSYTTAGATVNFIAPSTSFSFTVSPSITGYEWRLYEVDGIGSLDGAVEIDGEETASADNQEITNDAVRIVALQIISQPNHDYEESTTWYSLAAADQDVSVLLKKDINN